MKMKLTLVALAFILFNCKVNNEEPTKEMLKDGTFEIVELEGENVEEYLITAKFNIQEKKINGNGGCNNYNGSIEKLTKDSLVFGPVVSTKMFCEKGSTQETKFFALLNQVKTYEKDSTKLELKTKDGEVLIIAKKKE